MWHDPKHAEQPSPSFSSLYENRVLYRCEKLLLKYRNERNYYYQNYKLSLRDGSAQPPPQHIQRGLGFQHGVALYVQRYKPGRETKLFTYNNQAIDLETSLDSTLVYKPYRGAVTEYPIRVLSQSFMGTCYKGYLLLGETPKAKMRILFLWHEGIRQPELHFLDFSWQDMISDIDAFYAYLDASEFLNEEHYAYKLEVPRGFACRKWGWEKG